MIIPARDSRVPPYGPADVGAAQAPRKGPLPEDLRKHPRTQVPSPLYLLSSEILFPLFLEVERVTREGDDR